MSSAPQLMGPAAKSLRSSGCRIVITGASGWIGTATLELLHNTLGPEVFEERVVAFGSSPRAIEFGCGRTIDQRALSDLAQLPPMPSVVLHLAFLTKDRAERMDEHEYARANRALSGTVLESLDRIGAKAVFVASSGAAAAANDERAPAAMRLYGSLKKADEEAFASWAEQGAARAVICRIFALSGPHINKHETYALASFIKDALAGGPIIVNASHEVRRGYVAIRELVSLVFAMLLDGRQGATLFETGGEPMEMGEIAEAVSAVLGPVEIERPPMMEGASNVYLGDDEQYRQLLARYGVNTVQFSQQVAETAEFFRNYDRAIGIGASK